MSDQQLIVGLFASLAVTVVALVATLWTAHKHLVAAHIKAVIAFVVLLLVTLFFAESLGQRFDFEPTPMRIHLTLAYLTTAALLGPLVTGVQHWRGKLRRATHVWVVRAFLAILVPTLATGFWMFTERRPKPPGPAAPG
jgi:hypothetical protein